MTTQTINGSEILMVTVPEDAVKFYIPYLNELRYTTKPAHKMDWQSLEIKLEVGRYELIGKASDLTETQWQGIVERGTIPCDLYYLDYDWRGFKNNDRYNQITATDSGKSLLASHNLNPRTTLLIRKK